MKSNQSKSTGSRSKLAVENLVFRVGDEPPVMVPPGEYSVVYKNHNKSKFCGTDKLYIHFVIVDSGPVNGEVLFKVYNFYNPLPKGSDLSKDLVLLYGGRVRKSMKLSLSLFKGRVLRVKVRTMEKNRKQIPLARHQQYSVIDTILRAESGKSPGASYL